MKHWDSLWLNGEADIQKQKRLKQKDKMEKESLIIKYLFNLIKVIMIGLRIQFYDVCDELLMMQPVK